MKIGTWVKKDGNRGIIRGINGRKALVRWLGSNRAKYAWLRHLRKSDPPRALVLEGSLDNNLASTRSEEDVLRKWLDSNNIQLAYKNVHVLDDIRVIGKSIGRNRPPFVHISCHGDLDGFKNLYIKIAPGNRSDNLILLNNEDTIRVFKKAFGGIPLLFSACLLGKYKDEIVNFKNEIEVPYIAAFTRTVYDPEAMLFELMLYHGMLIRGWKFTTAVEKARDALLMIDVRGAMGHGQAFVRVF